MMNGNATAAVAGRPVNRGLHLDAATDRLLAVMAGRFDGNRSMVMRAALRLAAATWGVEAPPTPQGGET